MKEPKFKVGQVVLPNGTKVKARNHQGQAIKDLVSKVAKVIPAESDGEQHQYVVEHSAPIEPTTADHPEGFVHGETYSESALTPAE